MSSPTAFKIKESLKELKKMRKSAHPMLAKRIQAMIVFKNYEDTGISRRRAAEEVGVDPNSIHTWRNLYITGGLDMLLSHSNIGYKPNIVSADQENVLKEKLEIAENGIAGYVELLEWFKTTCNTDIGYNTFRGFVIRKFGAKVKVARKSHVKKDPLAIESFKKTSDRAVNKSSRKKDKALKK
jgi:transposase